jgi:hypothetical protein
MILSIACSRIRGRDSLGKKKKLLGPVFAKEGVPGIMQADIDVLPVIEPGALEMFVVDLETEGGH